MIRLARGGFGRDLLILSLVTIILGSTVASAVAVTVDRYFAGTVSNLIGDFGEYDVIVHVREEVHDAGLAALQKLLKEKLPGAHVKDGVSLAGKSNIFVSVPQARKNGETFGDLRSWMSSLPGYAGITFITEPSVVVSNVHAGVRDDLTAEIEGLAGVRFTFRDGNNIVAVLTGPEQAEAVFNAAKAAAAKYRILEVRYPFGYKAEAPQQVASDVEQALQDMWGPNAARDVTVLGQDDETGSFLTALSEMKRFLLSYATQVEVELVQPGTVVPGDVLQLQSPDGSAGDDGAVLMRVNTVNGSTVRGFIQKGDATPLLESGATVTPNGGEMRNLGHAVVKNERLQLIQAIDASLELLGRLEELSKSANGAVTDAEETLQTFEAALVQLEDLQEQVRQINEELTTKGEVDTGQILISALLSTLVKKVQPNQGSAADLKDADVRGMQKQLRDMSQQLEAVSKVDVQLIMSQIRQVRENLPRLSDTEIGDSLQLIDRYLEGQVLPGDRLQLLLSPKVDLEQSEALIKGVVANSDVTLFTSPAAVVSPDARATLFSILTQVRRIIAGITVVALLVLLLLLDHATLFSAFRRLGLGGVDRFAAGMSSVLLAGMYVGSGAGIPGMNLVGVMVIGAILGLLGSRLSNRLSPVDGQEIEAGLAMGLRPTQILREIVVPAGRPGLMMLLNRRRQAFR